MVLTPSWNNGGGMQYKTGTASVTFGSNIVTGIDTEWLSNISSGDLFSLSKSRVLYEVSSVDSDTQLTLVSDYRGGDATSTYTIHTNFMDGIPLLSNGDINTGTILTNMARRFQERFMTPSMEYAGVWQATTYSESQVVLKDSKLYLAITSTSSTPPSADWRMIYGGINFLYSEDVSGLGDADAGVDPAPAREDHTHPLPSVEDIDAMPDTITTSSLPENGDNRYYTLDREYEIITRLLSENSTS